MHKKHTLCGNIHETNKRGWFWGRIIGKASVPPILCTNLHLKQFVPRMTHDKQTLSRREPMFYQSPCISGYSYFTGERTCGNEVRRKGGEFGERGMWVKDWEELKALVGETHPIGGGCCCHFASFQLLNNKNKLLMSAGGKKNTANTTGEQ